MDTNLKTYETICLTKVDMPDDKFAALVERCKSAVLNDGKGEWLYTDDWGKAKIAFKINKDTRARWTYMRFKSEPKGVDELLRSLSINEFVLRQMTAKTKADGSDFDAYRQNMVADIAERGERPQWREERPSRYGGGRREYGGGGGRNDYDRGGNDNEGPSAGADEGAGDMGGSEE